MVACVLGERLAMSPADVSRGGASDDTELPQFPEQNPPVTAVCLPSAREPVYCRAMDGNENDAGTMRIIANDLKALKCGDLRVIFVRGSESLDDIAAMILAEQSFQASCKVTWEPVYRNLRRIKLTRRACRWR